eukprot:SAG11_NODE_217_length_12229_cov_9.152185_10_plen_91_part_00
MSALIDGESPLWLSSGLEDYCAPLVHACYSERELVRRCTSPVLNLVHAVLGAYFHSMPTEHLPYSGFENIEAATAMPAHGSVHLALRPRQ